MSRGRKKLLDEETLEMLRRRRRKPSVVEHPDWGLPPTRGGIYGLPDGRDEGCSALAAWLNVRMAKRDAMWRPVNAKWVRDRLFWWEKVRDQHLRREIERLMVRIERACERDEVQLAAPGPKVTLVRDPDS